MHARHIFEMRPHLVHLCDVEAFKCVVKLPVRLRHFLDPSLKHAQSLGKCVSLALSTRPPRARQSVRLTHAHPPNPRNSSHPPTHRLLCKCLPGTYALPILTRPTRATLLTRRPTA